MSFQPWFIDGRSRTEGGAFGALHSPSKPAPPVISGDPYQGQELTSTANREWSINGVPTGVVGDTFIVPESVLMGDEISQEGSNVLTVGYHPDAWTIRVETDYVTGKTTPSDSFHLQGRLGLNETVTIYWGDGTKSVVNTWNHADRIHQYAEEGTYVIQALGVNGVSYGADGSNNSDLYKITDILQWGTPWVTDSLGYAFRDDLHDAVRFRTLPEDTNVEAVADMAGFLYGVGYNDPNRFVLPESFILANATNVTALLHGSNVGDLPSGMKLSNVSNADSFMNGGLNHLSTERYSKLIEDLNTLNPNNNVGIAFSNTTKYNETAAPHRYNLYLRGWIITDGGADFVTPLLFGLPHAESLLWSTHTGQWAIDGTPVVGETGQTFTIPDDVTDGQEITQLDSDPLIVSSLDPDALNYILRVEDADQYPLEPAVKTAINDLFLAWKDAPAPIAANNWAAIAAGTGLLMAGPRTLAGALVPLDPNMPAPTNFNFVEGDYNRALGLQGVRIPSKNLVWDSFPNDLLPVDDVSLWSYLTSIPATGAPEYLATFSSGGSPGMTRLSEDGSFSSYLRNANYGSTIPRSALPGPGLFGASRVAGVKTVFAFGTSASGAISNPAAATDDPFALFRWRNDSETGTARISAVGCGESLDLEAMDTALTTYMAAIDSAI